MLYRSNKSLVDENMDLVWNEVYDTLAAQANELKLQGLGNDNE